MYAVIKTGGKQYRVSAGDEVKIETVAGTAGDAVSFGEVLMIGDGDDVSVGAPLLDGASVSGEIVDQVRNKKIIIFKKRRRQNSRRKNGHRQQQTLVKITGITPAA
ncbi:MAG: 50S ribosomal protein L21 [Acuticoccus sp.]